MKIENTFSKEFKFELLDAFNHDPEVINDFASLAGEQAKTLMAETIERALGATVNKLIKLHPGPLTIQISIAMGNSEDFENDNE